MATPRYQTLQELIQRMSKETSPSSRQSLSEQIRILATLGAQDLHVLRQNPFDYPPTIAVPLGDIMTDLSTINVVLSMCSLGVESLTDLAIEQVRSLWSEIVMWLDFLHPGNLVLCRNVSLSPLVIVGTSSCMAAALSYIFRWKHRFLDLLGQAPQCYRIAIDLWLRFPIYTQQSDFDENTYTTYDLLAETLPTVFAINGEPPSVVDFIAKEEAMAVVGHRAGRLHRKAMICLKLCAQSRYAEAASMTSNQISAMRFLVKHVLPMPCFPRDFVRDIVHITRLLQGQNQIDNAVAGCRLLEDVWEKAADDRSIIWAINAGIMPVLIAVNREGYLTPTMKIVVKRTVFLPVARALAKKHPEGLELRNGGMQPDLAVPMHEELADRMNIAKDYMASAPIASGSTERATDADADLLRRSPAIETIWTSQMRREWSRYAIGRDPPLPTDEEDDEDENLLSSGDSTPSHPSIAHHLPSIDAESKRTHGGASCMVVCADYWSRRRSGGEHETWRESRDPVAE
ncbi:uncharacterized protein SCHCODRAFT_02685124 [Schizophyllum commune H4-8]|uniref:uncharacterized protein n=1 Tax=Schizophyllum commune (strain H4-8 / FGSC 9210) TaxID=578458 RepID=UPI002160E97A|nr:uncharacterized protein SCHCODRAFT_02685124 [Schizophyllum commune H4-8]KAI5896013.1 hypothetical protein SCHCODRAFT_02685124 [Schizophyllum commune H4-8]